VRTGLTIAAAAALVTIVALASRSTSVISSATELDTGFALTAVEVVGYVAAIVGLVAFLPTIVVLRAQRRQMLASGSAGGNSAPWWTRIGGLVVTLVSLAIQIVIVVYVVDLLRTRGFGTNDGQLDPPTGLDPNGLGTSRDSASLLIALVIVTILAVVALALAFRWRLRDAADRDQTLDRRARTEQAVEVGLDALRRDPDPRRAIIAAYAAMERSLSHAGLGRKPWEAPIEYLRRVLAGTLGAPADVQTMTHLFEVAKFSQHAVDESMRTSAIGALERIRAATRAAQRTAVSARG
jgi:heme/copper-type cytochrome/quinol oxidase subunit 2